MTDLVFSPPALNEPPELVWTDEGGHFFPGTTAEGGFSLWIDDAGWKLPCVYSVGLTDYGLPELVFFGRNGTHLQQLWETLKHRLNEVISSGSTLFNGRLDARMTPVSATNCRELEEAVRRYGVGGFSALQLYWVVGGENPEPRRNELSFLAAQPYLGHGTLRELLEGGPL